MPKTSLHRA